MTYLQRPGNQAQMSVFNTPRAADHSVVRDTISHASAHLSEDLSTAALSARAGVSERHLDRLFVQEVGVTPGRFVRRIRTEAAAHLLTGTDLPIAAIATKCGFRSAETLRLAFMATYGVSPSQYRATQTRAAGRSAPSDR